MSVTIISTGRNAPTKHLCVTSVEMQLGGPYRHIYVESEPDVTPLENWHREIHKLPPDEIVVLLEGDDWLFSCQAMLQVQRAYINSPEGLLSYGSFIDEKGRPGFAAPYGTTDYRSAPWLATHLKTFRAGLFQKIRIEDLQVDRDEWTVASSTRYLGRPPKDGPLWIPMASDQAVMLPLLELSGPHRSLFIREPLVVYNSGSSYWSTTSDEGRAEESRWAQIIRSKPRYTRLP